MAAITSTPTRKNYATSCALDRVFTAKPPGDGQVTLLGGHLDRQHQGSHADGA